MEARGNKNMIQEELKLLIEKSLKNLSLDLMDFSIEHPADISHGDFATNVALIAAKQVKKNPREFAKQILLEIQKFKPDFISDIKVADPGFINFFLPRKYFSGEIARVLKEGKKFGQNKSLKGKKILVEYTDPNPFKEFHIGHLMSNTIGESIARLYENSGAKVERMCYQGDVGPHAAKALWAMKKNTSSGEHSEYLGKCYAKGSKAYEENTQAKKEIDEINKKIFERSDKELNKLYEMGKKWSLEHFDEFYKTLGTKFDHFVFESEVFADGVKIVKEFLKKGIFDTGEGGAIVFKADKYNPKLHTRVFITSQNLPTYETKELGLTQKKFKKIKPDLSIVVTANEQEAYFQVFLEALKHINIEWHKKTEHISHGMMKFKDGKMSSRTGNVVTGESLIRDVERIISAKISNRNFSAREAEEISRKIAIAAIKFSILRQGIASDIAFDPEASSSLVIDSGPYLQYSVVRAKSVLLKAMEMKLKPSVKNPEPVASPLEKNIAKFAEIAMNATSSRAPQIISTYLLNLAYEFNYYYASVKIADTKNLYSPYLLAITEAFAIVMQNGLSLLGIEIPEKM